MVETTGIEPVTPCMSSKYSNQLSYASVSNALSLYHCPYALSMIILLFAMLEKRIFVRFPIDKEQPFVYNRYRTVVPLEEV